MRELPIELPIERDRLDRDEDRWRGLTFAVRATLAAFTLAPWRHGRASRRSA